MAALDISDRMDFVSMDGVVPVMVAVIRPLIRLILKQRQSEVILNSLSLSQTACLKPCGDDDATPSMSGLPPLPVCGRRGDGSRVVVPDSKKASSFGEEQGGRRNSGGTHGAGEAAVSKKKSAQ